VFKPFVATTNAAHSTSTHTQPDDYNAGWELCTRVNQVPENKVFYITCKHEDGTERYPLSAQFGIYAEANRRVLFTEIELYEYDEQSSKLCFFALFNDYSSSIRFSL